MRLVVVVFLSEAPLSFLFSESIKSCIFMHLLPWMCGAIPTGGQTRETSDDSTLLIQK